MLAVNWLAVERKTMVCGPEEAAFLRWAKALQGGGLARGDGYLWHGRGVATGVADPRITSVNTCALRCAMGSSRIPIREHSATATDCRARHVCSEDEVKVAALRGALVLGGREWGK